MKDIKIVLLICIISFTIGLTLCAVEKDLTGTLLYGGMTVLLSGALIYWMDKQ